MLNSGQRSKLRGLAQNLNPIFQIGKNGISDNLVKDVDNALELHELVKISVLRSSELSARECLDELSKRLNAESVTAIGNRFVLYRLSSRDDIEHIAL